MICRSDNRSEFTAQAARTWLEKDGVKTLYTEPGSPWENGHVESFHGKLRDELLNGEIFYTLLEAKVLVERWRREYNTIRPHSALGYQPPAPQAWTSATHPAGSAPPARPPLHHNHRRRPKTLPGHRTTPAITNLMHCTWLKSYSGDYWLSNPSLQPRTCEPFANSSSYSPMIPYSCAATG